MFSVQIHLMVTGTTPADADGFNLWLETAAANNNLFTIISATQIVNWNTPASGTVSNDVLTTTNSSHSGFAQNTQSLGFVDSTPNSTNKVATPFNDLTLENVLIQTSNSVVIGNTYTFFITNALTSGGTGFPRRTGITDSNGNFFNAQTTGSFTITIVPEPATWSLFALGGLLVFAGIRRHAHRSA